jgi:hypothetical protein
VLEERRSTLINTKLDIRLGPKRRVGSHGDAERLAEFDEGFLGKVWVQLNLQYLGLVFGIPENVKD